MGRTATERDELSLDRPAHMVGNTSLEECLSDKQGHPPPILDHGRVIEGVYSSLAVSR
jgi:hypothetical protein